MVIALTGLPIRYSIIVALRDLSIGYSVIIPLTGLPIGKGSSIEYSYGRCPYIIQCNSS